MNTLSVIGLTCSFVGAIVLVGPRYAAVGEFLKKIDLIYKWKLLGVNTLISESVKESEDGKISPTGSMDAGKWEFIYTRWFLNQRIINTISKKDTVGLGGSAIRCNGDSLECDESIDDTEVRDPYVHVRDLDAWIEQAQERRMYRVGVGLLIVGFGIQFLDVAILPLI